jgi:hypothetical protein
MPRERLERTVVWQQLRFNNRKQKMDNGLLRKVEENPDLKRDYENLLNTFPKSNASGQKSASPERSCCPNHEENDREKTRSPSESRALPQSFRDSHTEAWRKPRASVFFFDYPSGRSSLHLPNVSPP